jgi:dTDP-4-amino-4,6-dideoxygalactose transaminase
MGLSSGEPYLRMSGMAPDRDAREIPVLRPRLPTAAELLPYLARIDATRCYTNWGPLASELERRLADRFGANGDGVISASSGTTALMAAILAAAGRATADRPLAIIPALTFVATAIAVEQCGYRVHLVDVSAEDWLLDPRSVGDHRLRDQVGVVVPVSAFGKPVAHGPWQAFRRNTGIPVVIDGAASFEAIESRQPGLVSDIPLTLSFHATKAFATSEGGCVVTSDAALATSVTRALNFGFHEDRESRAASTNGKMSEYHAAVGLAELDGWPSKRRQWLDVAAMYRARMREAGLTDRLFVAPDIASCYVLFRAGDAVEAARVGEALADAHVGFRTWYGRGIHTQPHFHDVSRDALQVTDRMAPLLIGLPVAPDLSPDDVVHVVAALARGTRRRA